LLAFGETMTLGIEDEWHVGKCGNGEVQRFVEQDLTRSGGEQIRTTHDLVDAHECVVNDNGKLVSEDAIGAAHDEVPHGVLNLLHLWTSQQVGEAYYACLIDAKT
jgi:hypothetical protein